MDKDEGSLATEEQITFSRETVYAYGKPTLVDVAPSEETTVAMETI